MKVGLDSNTKVQCQHNRKPTGPTKWVTFRVTKCAVTQGTQKGRFWVTQVSLTVTSTTGQHGHGTARSHLHTQRTHDGPSVSYFSTRRGRCLCSGGWSSASLVLLFIWHTQLGEIYRVAP